MLIYVSGFRLELRLLISPVVKKTAELVAWVRHQIAVEAPNFPLIASGGRTTAEIQATIDAGANAISFTAYGMTEAIFQHKMEQYRER